MENKKIVARVVSATSLFHPEFYLTYQDLQKSQNICTQSYLSKKNDNCLLEEVRNAGDSPLEGVDQALILLPSHIYFPKTLEVDVDKVVGKKELEVCAGSGRTLYTHMSYSPTHFHLLNIPPPVSKDLSEKEYFKSYRCQERSLFSHTYNRFYSKYVLKHNCPTLKGNSGAFMSLSCPHDKKALFVSYSVYGPEKLHHTVIPYERSFSYLGDLSNTRYETHFNLATHIDSKLLKFFYRQFCKN